MHPPPRTSRGCITSSRRSVGSHSDVTRIRKRRSMGSGYRRVWRTSAIIPPGLLQASRPECRPDPGNGGGSGRPVDGSWAAAGLGLLIPLGRDQPKLEGAGVPTAAVALACTSRLQGIHQLAVDTSPRPKGTQADLVYGVPIPSAFCWPPCPPDHSSASRSRPRPCGHGRARGLRVPPAGS